MFIYIIYSFFKVHFGEIDKETKPKEDKDNIIRYKSFTIDNHEYFVGDHVKLDPSEEDYEDDGSVIDDATKEFWYALITDIYYMNNKDFQLEDSNYYLILII